jgi:hypothetical protein
MKKIYSLSLFLLIGMGIHAQNTTIGLRTGLGRSTLKTDYADRDTKMNSKANAVAHVAVFVEHKLNNNLALQVELGLSNSGGRNIWNANTEDSFGNYKVVNSIYLGKLNLPLMVKYYFTEDFNINGGVNFAIIGETESKYRTRGHKGAGVLLDFFGGKEEIGSYVKKFEVNPFLGVEFHVSKKIFIDGRYIFGVSNVGKNISNEGFNVLKSSSLHIGIGFKIFKI